MALELFAPRACAAAAVAVIAYNSKAIEAALIDAIPLRRERDRRAARREPIVRQLLGQYQRGTQPLFHPPGTLAIDIGRPATACPWSRSSVDANRQDGAKGTVSEILQSNPPGELKLGLLGVHAKRFAWPAHRQMSLRAGPGALEISTADSSFSIRPLASAAVPCDYRKLRACTPTAIAM